jgi:Asp-tRNA(Asn)/Glu-tRNA(Gln) amidotransferase A subunit family amidase
MNDTDLAFMSVAEQASLIEKKELSPVDLIELYLKRIENGILCSMPSLQSVPIKHAQPQK